MRPQHLPTAGPDAGGGVVFKVPLSPPPPPPPKKKNASWRKKKDNPREALMIGSLKRKLR